PARSPLAGDEGRPLDESVRRAAGSLPLGPDLARVRVHQGPADRRFAARLGARAATHGRDVFLAEGESPTDAALMRHELSHVAAGVPGVHLRSATWLERRAWLSLYSHYLPRKFLGNYMDDTGRTIVLTPTEMQDCNAIVDIRRSTAFMTLVARLAAAGGGTVPVQVSGWGGARTNGTLGNFTIRYYGSVVVRADGTWTFTGVLTFYDYWDFDPKGSGSGRPLGAEVKVRVAATLLPGSPFAIESTAVAVTQSDSDVRAQWGTMAAPVHVPDRAGTTGADIAGGEVAGAPAGPPGADIGGEIGAQGSEDVNR
ncbi:eCIS core domain-containing protein, partial [Georgenia subflava]